MPTGLGICSLVRKPWGPIWFLSMVISAPRLSVVTRLSPSTSFHGSVTSPLVATRWKLRSGCSAKARYWLATFLSSGALVDRPASRIQGLWTSWSWAQLSSWSGPSTLMPASLAFEAISWTPPPAELDKRIHSIGQMDCLHARCKSST